MTSLPCADHPSVGHPASSAARHQMVNHDNVWLMPNDTLFGAESADTDVDAGFGEIPPDSPRCAPMPLTAPLPPNFETDYRPIRRSGSSPARLAKNCYCDMCSPSRHHIEAYLASIDRWAL
eukprot:111102-Karenia_brevis.AAC.1